MTCEHNLTTSFGPSSTVNPVKHYLVSNKDLIRCVFGVEEKQVIQVNQAHLLTSTDLLIYTSEILRA